MNRTPLRSALVLLASLPALAACSTNLKPPAPWERGDLARPAMRMDGDALERRFNEHIYASKENASGGSGVGGGGCGCN